jgi:hypothetical protein
MPSLYFRIIFLDMLLWVAMAFKAFYMAGLRVDNFDKYLRTDVQSPPGAVC